MAIRTTKIILIISSITIIFALVTYPFLNKNKTKILLIGLDGADWKVITPLIKEGKLPNIKQLMDKGCWGNLESLSPFISEVVWTTIATGQEPEKHGILDRLMEDPDTKEPVTVTSNLRKTKAIWNILSQFKKKVGVIGYMVTWPPEEVNGVMISDRANIYHHYLSKDYSHPPFVRICSKSDFLNLIDINNDILLKIISRENGIEINSFILDFVCHFINRDNFRANFANYLLVKQTFDFFLLYLQSPDPLSHYFWKYMFPEDFNVSDVSKEDLEKYKDIIADYYIYCDRVIGEFLNKIDKDTAIIIVSDHGFKARYKKEYIFNKLNDLLQFCGLAEIKRNSKKIIIRDTQRDIWWYERNIEISGDFSKEEFEIIREEIKKVFKETKILETDKNIFEFVRDIDKGFIIKVDKDYINEYPQHHILINQQKYKISEFVIAKPLSGDHAEFGIVILSGKNIRPNKLTNIATVYDITPTILYLMGLPVAKDMKGKVLVEALDDDLLRKQPIRYIDTYETDKKDRPQKPIRSPQDEEKIKERMRSLGYIQ